MKSIKRYWKLLIFLMLPSGILINLLSSRAHSAVERFYSRGLYRVIGSPLSLITGLVPISAAEIAVVFLVVFIIWRLIRACRRMLVEKKPGIGLSFLINAAVVASAIYFGFVMLWGLNYNRMQFADIARMEVRPASVDELARVCEAVIKRANALRDGVNENAEGVMHLPSGHEDALKRAYLGYDEAAKLYPELGGRFGRPKGVIMSRAMSYAGISGVYFPFTAEANVNIDIPHAMIPCTTSHEMAHQRGFAREDEANYIAYLTCSMHPDTAFQYSGALLALIYSMNSLYDWNREKYNELRALYSEGVRRDLAFNNQYWQSFEGPVQNISNEINNAYLKANLQADGVYSYGRMVDLLIAEYRTRQTGS